jgi:UrcA family protein
MVIRNLRFAAAAVGASAACLISAPGAAQSTVKEIIVHPRSTALAETRHKTVSYADLNLNSKSGQAALLRRIKLAGRAVCSPEPTAMSERKDYEACYDGAVSGALSDLGNSDVSAMYARMK